MTTAWRIHIGAVVLVGLGWIAALVYTLTGAEGPDWWFFVIGLTAFAFILTAFLRSLALEVRIAGDAVTVATAFGTRRIPLSDLDPRAASRG